jgi:hypothetical protein
MQHMIDLIQRAWLVLIFDVESKLFFPAAEKFFKNCRNGRKASA